MELREFYDLCDMWRVRNLKSKQSTFAQKQSSSFIQGRLDYMFIPNTVQEFVTMTEILNPILTDHSPVVFSLSGSLLSFRRKRLSQTWGFWKCNSSLTKDQTFIAEIKKLIRSFCSANISPFNRQLKWELLKYEVQKFTINYTKHIAKEK